MILVNYLNLLNYYDCVGINLRFYPNIHFSGNFWWSKSEHIKQLKQIDNNYLSPEMFICSKINSFAFFKEFLKSTGKFIK